MGWRSIRISLADPKLRFTFDNKLNPYLHFVFNNIFEAYLDDPSLHVHSIDIYQRDYYANQDFTKSIDNLETV